MIIEGSEIQGQFKNKPVFQYRPLCAHWFGSNHLPRVDDPDGGWSRRWLFFKFNKQLEREKRIEQVEELILAEEREAIMAWAVAGIVGLKANREYTLPPSHFECINDMNRKGDSVLFWLGHFQDAKRLRLGVADHKQVTTKSTSVESLFRVYRLFCSGTAAVPHVALQTFIERLTAHGTRMGFYPLRSTTGGVSGFSLITFVDDPGASPSR